MLDMHLHILPGVDDGSYSEEMSLEMAEIALDSGIDCVIATPHANQMGRFENFYTPEFAARFDRLREILALNRIPLNVLNGMEIMCSNDMTEKIKDGRLVGLNGTGRYLIEFPFQADLSWINGRINDVTGIGKTPVIAHAERYDCVKNDPDIVGDWVRMGAIIQVNRGSLFGRFGRASFQAADYLLNEDLVDLIASDAHGIEWRAPFLLDAYDEVAARFGRERAVRLFDENPRAIAEGRSILRTRNERKSRSGPSWD